ncbi:MAG: hypothetical protein WC804_11695 [Sphingomonas sp.]|uniref:hypothetical protein n=1 Tax=Sphingomonas sp. TaxID=28214 RepID=UPI003564CDC2
MSGRAEALHLEPRNARTTTSAPPVAAALAETDRSRSLAATARLLNARPALVAQRALAESLARPHRPIAPSATASSSTRPVQLMNGQPPDDDEWGPFQGADAQHGAGNGVQANQPVANIIGEDEWGPFQGGGNPPPTIEAADENWANFGPHDGAPAQEQDPHAGHGLAVAIGEHASANGPMYTTDLFNCIALVAFDPQTPLACLYHWNTGLGAFEMAYDGEDDEGEDRYRLVPSPDGIEAAKAVVDAGAPGAAVYRAVLGRSWGDAELAPRRAEFVAALEQVLPGITIFDTPHGSARWVAPNLIGYG